MPWLPNEDIVKELIHHGYVDADGHFSISGGVVPAPHAVSHASVGGDPVDVKTLAGYPGGSTTFLRADGTFAAPAGAGNVVGPASSVAGHIASFADATGKLLLDAANVAVTGSVAVGAIPAGAGALRLANNLPINARNAANTNDLRIAVLDSFDEVILGSLNSGGGTLLDGFNSIQVRTGAAAANQFIFDSRFYPASDGLSDLGVSIFRWKDLYLAGSVIVGTNPAAVGAIRLANNLGIYSRNAANNNDLRLAVVDSSNSVVIGDTNAQYLYLNGGGTLILNYSGGPAGLNFGTGALAPSIDTLLDIGLQFQRFKNGWFSGSVIVGTNPAGAGAVRLPNMSAISFRNAANTQNIDAMFVDNNNAVLMGAGAAYYLFQTNILVSPTATYDIGSSGLRFKDLYLSGSVNAPVIASALVTLVDGATPPLDASLGTVFRLAAAGDRTIGIPTNPKSGQQIFIVHFASGAIRTLALNTGANGFRFGSDITGLTATVSGKTDYIGAQWNSTDSKWDVILYRKGY